MFSLSTPTRRQLITAGALAVGAMRIGSAAGIAAVDNDVTHAAEAIHQEPLITASSERIYRVLTNAKLFEKLTRLSAAFKDMANKHEPAMLDGRAGGAFALFGGYITGRFVELVPNERVVQAWRAASWDPGVYSIARFQLVEQSPGTKIIFDHAGFPIGQAEHLAKGWQANYWDPLRQLL
jgi:activator of HSP90 ATPase